ncbi:cytochrome P450 [Streptomyces clavuligerus]|uniref:cytochrome P450 n=1 Tax=Streptomyces clavuligerus TaxID=1901 RepID=UPI001E6073AD|nr:cytochrome P450 [Streptomyces clavuligerus]
MVSRFRVPTAPGGLPFVGHTRRLSHDPLAYLRSLRGAGDLVRLRVGPRCVYLVTCPALTRRVLVDEARSFDKGAMFDELRLGMGNGLVISGGAFHRRQRRLAQPAFHPARIDGYTRAMTRRAGERTAAWQSGVTLDLTRELDELTLDILLDTVLGDSAGAVREDVLRWLSAKSGVMRRVLSPLSAWRARLLRPGPARPLPVTEDTLASLRALLAVEIHRGRLAPVGGAPRTCCPY